MIFPGIPWGKVFRCLILVVFFTFLCLFTVQSLTKDLSSIQAENHSKLYTDQQISKNTKTTQEDGELSNLLATQEHWKLKPEIMPAHKEHWDSKPENIEQGNSIKK